MEMDQRAAEVEKETETGGSAPPSTTDTPRDVEVETPKKKVAKHKPKRSAEEERERTTRTVFVGNVPLATQAKELKALFREKCGAVASVRFRGVPTDPSKSAPKAALVKSGQLNTGMRSSMTAYVVFKEVESVAKAVAMNMTEFQGKHLRVVRTYDFHIG